MTLLCVVCCVYVGLMTARVSRASGRRWLRWSRVVSRLGRRRRLLHAARSATAQWDQTHRRDHNNGLRHVRVTCQIDWLLVYGDCAERGRLRSSFLVGN